MKNKNKEVIKRYNHWVKNQLKIFKNISSDVCPYFLVDNNILKEFSNKERMVYQFKVKNKIAKEQPLLLWQNILSQDIKKYKPTKSEIKVKSNKRKIKYKIPTLKTRILSENIRFTEKIHESNNFITLCKYKGLFMPKHHLTWYEDNGIIQPLLKQKNKKYYSLYQVFALDLIEKWKEDSLEYPNPQYCLGRSIEIKKEKKKKNIHSPGLIKQNPILWTDYLLCNRKTILTEVKRWNAIASILLDIRDLYAVFKEQTFKEISRIKKEHRKQRLLEDTFNGFIYNGGQYYCNKIKNKHPDISESIIRYWQHVCLCRIVELNPLLSRVNVLPALIKISKDDVPAKPPINYKHKRNNIVLAKFYWTIYDYLNFYLECLNQKKEPSVVENITSNSINDERICPICRNKFIPNPNRKGGTTEVICRRPQCDKDYRALKEKERRKKLKYRKQKA